MQVLGKGKEFLVGEWESVAWRRGSRLRLCCQPSYCCGQLELHASTEDGTLGARVKHTILISSVIGWGLLLGDVNCQATSSMPHRYRIRAGFCSWRKPRGRESRACQVKVIITERMTLLGDPCSCQNTRAEGPQLSCRVVYPLWIVQILILYHWLDFPTDNPSSLWLDTGCGTVD